MLTLQFVPYNEIESLSSNSKVRKLLNLVKENKIVLMEGRLKPNEETDLIQRTMESVSKDFKGIELCTIYPNNKNKFLKTFLISLLIGDRTGLTVVGPANIVKEIKRDPNKILLLTENLKRKRKK
ncbi:MAG: DUF2073 domain-containing protein [Candidatus Nanoarchaeia archaeon]|jgi:hypothetical protein|nr:DUF2073 domain-containing protein [Candidatus Nanoarchaeia archaeon]|tara:strand:+ start:46906 stop:47280 length:375 start_codon:yes stop_codon:yes gene_type:complete